MKKTLALILALLMMFTLVACGGSNSEDAKDNSTKEEQQQAAQESRPGDSASVLEDAGVSSGALSESITTMDPNHGITTEGKSEDVKIVIAQETDLAATHPFSQGSGRNQTKFLLYDELAVMRYPGGSVEDMDWIMAKNITKVDNDTYDIEIYDYIHDWAGNPITADDVVFSYNEYVASGSSGKFNGYLGNIEALDTYLVRLTLKNNSLGAIQYMLQNCPVVSQAAYESQSEADRSQNPIGTGMYKISEFVAGGYVTMTRVEDYWQTDASKWSYMASGQLEEIKCIIMTENSQRSIALENGSVDVVPNVAIEDIGNFMNDDGTAKEGYNVLKVLNSLVDYAYFNCNEESICSDINMRLAITYAIDRAGVMDGTYGKGGWLPTNETATSVVGDYNSEWTWYEYDMAKAQEYLAKTSYNGEEIIIMCPSENYRKTQAELMQAYLSAVGITATITPYDSALLTEYRKDPTLWDMMIDGGGSSDYCVDTWKLFLTEKVDSMNSCLVVDTEVLELVQTAGGLDTHSQEAADAVHNYLYDHVYTMPLGTYYKYSAASSDLLLWALHPWNYTIFGGFIFK